MKKRNYIVTKCTQKEYESVLGYITFAVILAVINLDYIFISKAKSNVFSIIFLLINVALSEICKRYLEGTFLESAFYTKKERSIVYCRLTAMVSFILYNVPINVSTRNILVMVTVCAMLIYTMFYFVVYLVDLANGMEAYLKGEQ